MLWMIPQVCFVTSLPSFLYQPLHNSERKPAESKLISFPLLPYHFFITQLLCFVIQLAMSYSMCDRVSVLFLRVILYAVDEHDPVFELRPSRGAEKIKNFQSLISKIVAKLGDLTIWRLVRLGWTQTAAGKLFGLERQTVGNIAEKLNNQVFSIQHQFFQNKIKIEDIAKVNKIEDHQILWAMILDGKEDIERFKLLKVKPKAYDVWNFPEYRLLWY